MSIESDIRSIISSADAEFGISVEHLESGEELHINADTLFLMCSVLKIPVLAETFHQVEQGNFGLDDRWEVTLAEKNLPSGILVFFEDGLRPTVRDLLTLMIIISDNTATDMILNRIGTRTVTELMHSLGLTNIHVPLTIRDIFNDILGDAADPRRVSTNLDVRQEPPPANREGLAYHLSPKNDVSTARDMTRLLTKIFQGEVVSRSACDQMLHILLQQQLNTRLPSLLPEGVPFAHKTGTLTGYRNDAGILYAGEESHVAVTVYCRWDAARVEGSACAELARTQQLDRVFGEIGLALYERYS
jgi:beta-lactamase class A